MSVLEFSLGVNTSVKMLGLRNSPVARHTHGMGVESGARGGNRTLMAGLEDRNSAVELRTLSKETPWQVSPPRGVWRCLVPSSILGRIGGRTQIMNAPNSVPARYRPDKCASRSIDNATQRQHHERVNRTYEPVKPLSGNEVVKNAVRCRVCGAPADRHHNRFECRKDLGHMADLVTGIFTDMTPPAEVDDSSK